MSGFPRNCLLAVHQAAQAVGALLGRWRAPEILFTAFSLALAGFTVMITFTWPRLSGLGPLWILLACLWAVSLGLVALRQRGG